VLLAFLNSKGQAQGMNFRSLSRTESATLAILSAVGLIVPNGIFLYVSATDRMALREALANPISAVFMVEALFLMFLFAWLLSRGGSRKPTGIVFILLSLVGSLAFSVPLTLRWLAPSLRRD